MILPEPMARYDIPFIGVRGKSSTCKSLDGEYADGHEYVAGKTTNGITPACLFNISAALIRMAKFYQAPNRGDG